MPTTVLDIAGATMAKQRHLPRAPITEALIDLRVQARDGFAFSDLKAALGTPDFGYYVKNSITEGTFEFKLPPGGQPPETAAQSAETGLRLHSHDERYVAQWQLGGLTLSRLPPYEDWSRLVAEARRLWDIYVGLTQPKRITRVSTRFINNLQLPLASGESFQAYVNKLVDVPDEAPQSVQSFFQRFQLVDAASGAIVMLTLALDGRGPVSPVPVILDVDALVSTDLDPRDTTFWSTLDRLRELKNQCFFGTLTERAVELYA